MGHEDVTSLTQGCSAIKGKAGIRGPVIWLPSPHVNKGVSLPFGQASLDTLLPALCGQVSGCSDGNGARGIESIASFVQVWLG